MFSFNFWIKWLLTVSFLLIMFGWILILFNQTAFFNFLFNDWINTTFWGSTSVPGPTALFQQWIYGTLGAVIVGWGIFLTFISTHPFRNKEPWSWNCMVFGITIWFMADTTVSFYFHVWLNVILNSVLFVAFALPLIFTRKYFFK